MSGIDHSRIGNFEDMRSGSCSAEDQEIFMALISDS